MIMTGLYSVIFIVFSKNHNESQDVANSMTKPFLKWAGGKTQLLHEIDAHLPESFKKGRTKHYFEPFLGGGAVFFYLAEHYNFEKAFLYDINADLVNSYRVVRDKPEEYMRALEVIKSKYKSLSESERKDWFYDLRSKYNRAVADKSDHSEPDIQLAVWLTALNKTCFNGLFRQNKKGAFNVPFGKYKSPAFYDEKNILKASDLLKKAEIQPANYFDFEALAKPGDFVYFDPPYRPLSKTASFTSYAGVSVFDDAAQTELAALYRRLHSRSVNLMLSNSDPRNSDPSDDFFDTLYKGFTIRRVAAGRAVNSVGSKRGKISELLITNYSQDAI